MMPAGQRMRFRRLRWTAFGVAGLAYVLSFFHRFAPAAIAGELRLDFDVGAAALGGLAATYFYIYTLMQIPTGVLVDTLGPRRILAAGGVVAGIGSLLFGSAEDFTLAALGRLLVGLGVSVTFIALLKLNAAWFSERRFGTLTGLTILLGNTGALLAASPLVWALGFMSWRTMFIGVGLGSLLLALLAWWLVRDHPGEAGLPSPREQAGEAAHAAHRGHWLEGLREVVGNRLSWPGFFVSLGSGGVFFAFGGLWSVPLLTEGYGLSRGAATQHVSLLLLGFALGAFFIGTLSDHLGRRKPVLLAAAGLHLLCWLPIAAGLPLVSGLGHALFFLMGLGASSLTLTWACAKEVNRHALSGMATSLVNTGGFLGAAILQPLVGWTLDQSGASGGLAAFRPGMGLMTGFVVTGLVAAFFVRETHCRYQPPSPIEPRS
jgi:sugar phosphate permease